MLHRPAETVGSEFSALAWRLQSCPRLVSAFSEDASIKHRAEGFVRSGEVGMCRLVQARRTKPAGSSVGDPQGVFLLVMCTCFRLPREADVPSERPVTRWVGRGAWPSSVRCAQRDVCRLPTADPSPRFLQQARRWASTTGIVEGGVPSHRIDTLPQSGPPSSGHVSKE